MAEEISPAAQRRRQRHETDTAKEKATLAVLGEVAEWLEENDKAYGEGTFSLSIKKWKGAWMAVMNDKAVGRSCSEFGEALSKALDKLADRLNSSHPRWRFWEKRTPAMEELGRKLGLEDSTDTRSRQQRADDMKAAQAENEKLRREMAELLKRLDDAEELRKASVKRPVKNGGEKPATDDPLQRKAF